MARNWRQLYTLQDWALTGMPEGGHSFYLSGGTALARGYYHHRYSEDLDFFANDAPEFELWRDRCLNALQQRAAKTNYRLEIVLREARFGRAILHGETPLKLEFINDVPFRVGEPQKHPALGLLDTKENILANKISALVDRDEPKDVADIFWLCCMDGLDLVAAIENANGKAAGIFPPLVAENLTRAVRQGLPKVFWQQPPSLNNFTSGIEGLIAKILA
jgi:predicted nucleotidyltransferase component of viral defense system